MRGNRDRRAARDPRGDTDRDGGRNTRRDSDLRGEGVQRERDMREDGDLRGNNIQREQSRHSGFRVFSELSEDRARRSGRTGPDSRPKPPSTQIPNPAPSSIRSPTIHGGPSYMDSSPEWSSPRPLYPNPRDDYVGNDGDFERGEPLFTRRGRVASKAEGTEDWTRDQRPSEMPYRLPPDPKGKSAERAGRSEANNSYVPSSMPYPPKPKLEETPTRKQPRETPWLLSEKETDERMSYWWKEGANGRFNPQTHIVDPDAHYSYLYYLERKIVTSSYYFYCNVNYPDNYPNPNLIDGDILRDLGELAKDADLLGEIPRDVQEVLKDRFFSKHPAFARDILNSVSGSYVVLCRVLNSFDCLRDADFCGEFFSILVHSSMGIAQLVAIHRGELVMLKRSFEKFLCAYGRDKCYQEAGTRREVELEGACHTLNEIIGLHPPSSRGLALYRMTVLILDLGLITYVGSHGSLFTDHIQSEIERIVINFEKENADFVTCSLKRLACLNEFLDTPVWVFDTESTGNPIETEGLSILTHMDVFADNWGPVWTVPAEQDSSSNRVLQYNLSRGCIRRTGNQFNSFEGVVSCHWYGSPLSSMEPVWDVAASSFPLHPDDLLLIGAALIEDPQCPYKLKHYERDYLHTDHMGLLGTIPREWRLDARTLGFSAGQYVGVTGSLTQKMLPGVTIKESIWNEISQNPQMANIEWLNNFYGVEISHCSGNARRVRMKDLFRVKGVRKRLGSLIPSWETTSWGTAFSRALDDPSSRAIQRMWDDITMREDIGKLITGMLRLLHTTGGQGRHVIAAYFASGMDKFTNIPTKGNEWAKNLHDTTLTATYAVIGDVCLKYPFDTSGHTCSQQGIETRTVFETRIKFQDDLPSEGEYVTVKPIGNMFHVAAKITDGRDEVLRLAKSRIPIQVRSLVGREIDRLRSKRGQALTLIEASQPSFSGMSEARQVVKLRVSQQQIVSPAAQGIVYTGSTQVEWRESQQSPAENLPERLQHQRRRSRKSQRGNNTRLNHYSESRSSGCCFQ